MEHLPDRCRQSPTCRQTLNVNIVLGYWESGGLVLKLDSSSESLVLEAPHAVKLARSPLTAFSQDGTMNVVLLHRARPLIGLTVTSLVENREAAPDGCIDARIQKRSKAPDYSFACG